MMKTRILDKNLFFLWNKPGFEILCSFLVVDMSNKTIKNKSICRVPILLRSYNNELKPDSSIGCISCVTSDAINSKPIWWNSVVNF
mmetsp:Transcript_14003/g.21193  ORF Transcript_14003/g.21193 Transcript_14003/m.21193 type:complete len:86 (+) Transcript_14003:548-805(+)